MDVEWDWGRVIPRKRIHKWDFHCSAIFGLNISLFVGIMLQNTKCWFFKLFTERKLQCTSNPRHFFNLMRISLWKLYSFMFQRILSDDQPETIRRRLNRIFPLQSEQNLSFSNLLSFYAHSKYVQTRSVSGIYKWLLLSWKRGILARKSYKTKSKNS